MNKKTLLIITGCIVLLFFLKFLFIGSYTACGCGCCSGTWMKNIKFTLTPDEIIKDDKNSAQQDICALVDCDPTSGTKYYYFKFTRKTK